MADYSSYIRGWRQRWKDQRVVDEEAAGDARRIADRLARLLRERYSPQRIILVGSLARGEFGVGSDIDFAVEGIPDDQFFRAGADLDAAASGLHVDLVPIESADPAFLSNMAREGITLHDTRH